MDEKKDRTLHVAFINGGFATLAAIIAAVAAVVAAILVSTGAFKHAQPDEDPVPSVTATASPTASASPPGPKPSSLTYLTSLTERTANTSAVTGAVTMDAQSYPQSIRLTCLNQNFNLNSTVVYTVAGYKYLTATLGVPDDATNAAGQTGTFVFLKNAGTVKLAPMYSVTVGNTQKVRIDLRGSSQLGVACGTHITGSTSGGVIDVALGDAALSN